MQNNGLNSIVADLPDSGFNFPQGMVVFYRTSKYDKDGYCMDSVAHSELPLVHAILPDDADFNDYTIAGVTFVSTTQSDTIKMTRATVHISGSVMFCNTSSTQISAGQEVWVKITKADPMNTVTVPETIGRIAEDTKAQLINDGYRFLGLCVQGVIGSDIRHSRLSFGQVMLGFSNTYYVKSMS